MFSPTSYVLILALVVTFSLLAASVQILREIQARCSLHFRPLSKRQGAGPCPINSLHPGDGARRFADPGHRNTVART